MRTAGAGGLGLVLAIGAVVAGSGQEAAAPRPGDVDAATVEFRGGAGTIKGYLARPKGAGPFPAIVLVHERWGLNDWIRESSERLAAKGHVVLAVDLYAGKVPRDPGEAQDLMRALDESGAVADLMGGVAYLKGLPYVAKAGPVGAIGWSMGGKFARLLAQASDAIGPTVICYGSVTTDAAEVAKLQGKPILGIFASRDGAIPVAQVQQFGALLRQKRPATIRIYEDADHGFMRPGGPQSNPRAAVEAWKEIEGFFAANLKG